MARYEPRYDAEIKWFADPISNDRAFSSKGDRVLFLLGKDTRDAFLRAVRERQRREAKAKRTLKAATHYRVYPNLEAFDD
jgi:hypothetical protein